jgi:hypothetical protein
MSDGFLGWLAIPAILGSGLLCACRFGGPTGNPEAYVAIDSAHADATTVRPTTADDAGSSSTPADDAMVTPAPDAASPPNDDASTLDAAAAASGGGDDGNCAATAAVCDPVHNTGCNPFQQCDVNPLVTTAPTGQCVFGADGGSAAGCLATIFTESCAPQFTCVDGGCRQLCFCNADCTVGQCCTDRSGPAGFTLCGPCR